MSRRKQANPKPIKLEEEEEEEGQCDDKVEEEDEEEEDEETDEEKDATRNNSSSEGSGSDESPPLNKKKGKNSAKTKQESESADEAGGSSYKCPVCKKALDSQHDFTLHIRLHNSEDNASSHTCKLCGKTLSSASSLDRHMLVHSGERPFKCNRCSMAFTTNGNMHRHMRTHHGETESDDCSEKRPRQMVVTTPKRSLSPKPENSLAVKKVAIANTDESGTDNEPPPEKTSSLDKEEEQLHCPVCSKTFLCKYGLQTHLETHPDFVLKCQDCNLTFRNFRGLNRHQFLMHIKKPNESSQPGSRAPIGFQDLTFVDFSSEKFPLIAKAFCEKNARRPSSLYHMFQCSECKKAFPCGSALKMHISTSHSVCNNAHCTSCDSNFLDSTQLAAHHLRHSSELSSENMSQVSSPSKENFLAVLELQTNTCVPLVHRLKEEPYENLAYFTHGIPMSKNSSPNINKNGVKHSRISSGANSCISDTEDLSDIQSILTITSSPNLLPSMKSSPVAASSSSPRRGLAIDPESPAAADSATASPELPPDITEQASTVTSSSHNSSGLSPVKTRFPCKLCHQVFPNLRALKGHNRTHLGMSPYRCNMCSYTSIDKSTLLRHLRTHNGERPFLCLLCQYAFTTKANCERHVRKRHGKHSKQDIRNSMQFRPQTRDQDQTLNSFHCPDTVCKYCNVDFKFYRVLRHHLRSLHSSCTRKPFRCQVCRMGFSTKNNCFRHVLKQHPDLKNEDKIWTYSSDHQSDQSDDGSLTATNEDEQARSMPSLSPGPPMLDPVTPEQDLSNAETLASWSTQSLSDIPLQEEPLDLAIHPVDLSIKKSDDDVILPLTKDISQPKSYAMSSTPNYTSIPPPGPAQIVLQSSPFLSRGVTSFYNSPRPTLAPNLPILSGPRTTPSPPPLNLDKTPIQLDSSVSPRSNHSSLSCSPAINFSSPPLTGTIPKSPEPPSLLAQQNSLPNLELSKDNAKPIALLKFIKNEEGVLKKQKQKRYRTERPFRCTHCEAGFTLRSNMERHIKQQHPEHWATRARGRKLNGTAVAARSILPKASETSRPISNQVREAISQQIRQRLGAASSEGENSQTSSATFTTIAVAKESSPEHSSSPTSFSSKSKDENSVENQEAAQDLVSVSRLVDIASMQNIQEIFRDSEEGLDSQNSLQEDKTDSKKSAYTNAPNRVSCPYCSRRFPWTSSLRRHILTHTGQKPFKCPHCPLLFTTKSNCDRHLVRKHGSLAGDSDARTAPERPYRCNLCPNSAFSTPSNLRKHLQQKHGSDDADGPWEETGDSSNSLSDTETQPASLNSNNSPSSETDSKPSYSDTSKKISKATDEEEGEAVAVPNQEDECDVSQYLELTMSKADSSENLKADSVDDPNSVSCSLCSTICRNVQELNRHMKMHKDEDSSSSDAVPLSNLVTAKQEEK